MPFSIPPSPFGELWSDLEVAAPITVGLHETRTTLLIFEYGAIGGVMVIRNLYGWTSVWDSPRRMCVLGEGRNSRYQIWSHCRMETIWGND
jgi:hypothetical protein